jgi:hypothetical protein
MPKKLRLTVLVARHLEVCPYGLGNIVIVCGEPKTAAIMVSTPSAHGARPTW